MATQATIPSTTSTILVECRHNGVSCFAQHPDLPYSTEDCVEDFIQAQFEGATRVLLLDPAAGTCRDISAQIAEEIYRREYVDYLTLNRHARDFCEHHAGLRPAVAA